MTVEIVKSVSDSSSCAPVHNFSYNSLINFIMDNSVYFIEQERVMNLVEKLISEVEKRPLLWDRFDNDYSNRAAMDAEWEKIAEILSRDKNYVKNKWRNLRDQFIRENKKVKVPFDNPTKPYISYYRGKWAYFENMLFLKRASVPTKKAAGYSSTDEVELFEEEIKEEVLDYEDDIFIDSATYNSETESNKVDETLTARVDESFNGNNTKFDKEVPPEEETGRKRKTLETADTVVKAKRQSIASTPNVSSEDQGEIDDDLHFVKSLVPFLRKLSPIRKLLVRNEIQSLLIRESLCEKCKVGNHSTHNS
ncbi:transcription factor Adf-1-like [Trichoplusia ni]|uniref:Transcription factor Adf-1-like n=1 Tax=Trichoplusia ni TaxID=7111 RepID=A0A7E5VBV6_TRINI|nr:transcription factor Adf-1-like [Trichoplusia ni]